MIGSATGPESITGLLTCTDGIRHLQAEYAAVRQPLAIFPGHHLQSHAKHRKARPGKPVLAMPQSAMLPYRK